jgi:superfamily II DNA or RNA helicase
VTAVDASSPLLAAVRAACKPGLWSQGVTLARDGAVVIERASKGEVTARVKSVGRAVAPTVNLYLDDLEWSCDCGGKLDPCEHVAAAAITAAKPIEAASATKRMSHQLSRLDGTLFVERAIVDDQGHEEPFSGSLATLVARGDAPILPTHDDLALDRMISGLRDGIVPDARVADLLARLGGAADVRLDGVPVTTSTERVVPRATVRDKGADVELVVERDPRVDEVVSRGLARLGSVLHPLAETQLSGDRLEKLPLSRVFPRAALGELVTEMLPELTKRIPVAVLTKRLPGSTTTTRPRIAIELGQKEHTLSVLPLLVYGDPPVARVDGGRLVHLGGAVPVRDERAERALVDRLRDELNLMPGRRVDLDGDAAARFAAKLAGFRDDATQKTLGEVFGRSPLVPRFEIEGDAFDVVFEVERGDDDDPDAPTRTAGVAAVLRAWHAGLGLVPLDGGGWAPLPAAWLDRFGDRVADLVAARGEDKKIATALMPALAALCDDLSAPRPPGFEALAPLIAGFDRVPDATLPPGLTATLRPYQLQGVAWLAFLRRAGLGAVLADDMGLGKTLQTLAAIEGRALVVCPRSVVFNWEQEIARFRPDLRVAVFHGPRRVLDPRADVTLTTYAVLRMDVERLASEAWDAVVLDESQTIKNPDSQAARAAYRMKGRFRVALSGTPVENRLEELWSALHFTNPGLLGGRADFKARFEAPIANGDPGAAARLREKIKPFVLRRRKRDVAPELPPRTDSVLWVDLEEDERAVYDAVRAATQKEIVAKLAAGGSVLMMLEALLRLRQAACHAALVPGQRAATSSKVEATLGALEDAAADGHKAIVFSQWTSMLDLVEPHLRAAGVAFTRLDGSTRDRGAVVAEFQADGGPPVLLASLKAGGTGLNLTAADHVFLLDPWWNPAVEDQAADRAHRIGQDKPVFVYRLVAKDTVEERILALQERKRAVADLALGGADQAAAITRDDLLALLA